MSTTHSLRRLAASALSVALTSISPAATSRSVSAPLAQSGIIITATGHMAEANGDTFTWSFDFDPEGGHISNSYNGEFAWTGGTGKNRRAQGPVELSADFAGRDGGAISGTFLAHAESSPYDGSAAQPDWESWWPSGGTGGTWEGHLRADGTGDGTALAYGNHSSAPLHWSVTFDAQLFRDVLGIAALPTDASVFARQVELTQEARDFIASSQWLSEATKAVLDQDSVILARDDNNHFYAINNKGKAIPIPAPLSKKFDMSNEFTILFGKGLLDASGHGATHDFINGGVNATSLAKIPGDLKNHDYSVVITDCSSAGCQSQMKMNSTASSMHLSDAEILGTDWRKYSTGGSEHGSVRGTINGGGDFIYAPGSRNHLAFVSLLPPWSSASPDANNPPYLGVQAQDGGDGAVISMIQRTSPAEQAGLAIGDKVVSVSGTPVDAEHTLALLISQFAGGDQVDLEFVRNASLQTIPVRLAQILPPKIVTPSAEITLGDHTELAVDIGFNGVTGVLVLAQSAIVSEPVTGARVNVPAGSAVIVVPGYDIGDPMPVTEDQVTQWWKGETAPNPVSPTIAPVSSNWLLGVGALGLCGGGIILIGALVFFSRRRPSNAIARSPRTRPGPPESLRERRPAPPETLGAKRDARKPPPPERL